MKQQQSYQGFVTFETLDKLSALVDRLSDRSEYGVLCDEYLFLNDDYEGIKAYEELSHYEHFSIVIRKKRGGRHVWTCEIPQKLIRDRDVVNCKNCLVITLRFAYIAQL